MNQRKKLISLGRDMYVLFLLLFLGLSQPSKAEKFVSNQKINDSVSICKRVDTLSVSVDDMPSGSELKKLKACNAHEIYYGVYFNSNYEKARYCAIKNKDYKILSLLYANGYDVKRNFDLALHFACMYSTSEKTRTRFVTLLLNYEKQGNYKRAFNGCDADDNMSAGICWGLELDRYKFDSINMFLAIKKSLVPSARRLLMDLADKNDLYVQNRSYFELENVKISTVNYMILEEIKLQEEYMWLLEQTQKCSIQHYTKEDYKTADEKLNAVYKRLRSDQTLFKKLSVQEKILKFKDILKTELSWIKYKETMTILGHLNCPNIDEYSWGTILTRQRIEQLEELSQRFS